MELNIYMLDIIFNSINTYWNEGLIAMINLIYWIHKLIIQLIDARAINKLEHLINHWAN